MNAPEFTVNRDMQNLCFFPQNTQILHHSKSSGNIQQQMQLAAIKNQMADQSRILAPQTILVTQPVKKSGPNVHHAPSGRQQISVNNFHLLILNTRLFYTIFND